jgi:hypothetical protein
VLTIPATDVTYNVPPPPPAWTWIDELKARGDHEDVIVARALDLAGRLAQRYSDELRPGAPAWAGMVYRVARSATAARVRWNGPLFHTMPYCLHPTASPDRFVILNRRYKPIGYKRCGWADYEAAGLQHISADHVEQLRIADVVDAAGYLHDDRTSPRSSAVPGALNTYRRKLLAMLDITGALL